MIRCDTMSMQDKFSKVGGFLDSFYLKAKQAQLKEKLLKGTQSLKEGAQDVKKRAQRAYKAYKAGPPDELVSIKEVEGKKTVIIIKKKEA